jgi:hypothetical protein
MQNYERLTLRPENMASSQVAGTWRKLGWTWPMAAAGGTGGLALARTSNWVRRDFLLDAIKLAMRFVTASAIANSRDLRASTNLRYRP